MKYTLVALATLLGFSFTSALWAGTPQMQVNANPPLPPENLVKNGGFENGLEDWGTRGETIVLSDFAHKGKHSLSISVATGNTPVVGVYKSMTSLLSSGRIVPGKYYVLTCYVQADKKISNVGGDGCGAGADFAFFSSDWKKSAGRNARTGFTGGAWRKLVSPPLQCPEWAKHAETHVNVAYTNGEACIDDICVCEAYTDLSINITGSEILQVIVENESGDIVFDSGELSEGTKDFSKNLKVISVFRYKVTVMDKDGNVFEKEYPTTE